MFFLALYHLEHIPKSMGFSLTIYNGATSKEVYQCRNSRRNIPILAVQKFGGSCLSYFPLIEGIFLTDRNLMERECCGAYRFCQGNSEMVQCCNCFQKYHSCCVLSPKVPFKCGCHTRRPYPPKEYVKSRLIKHSIVLLFIFCFFG